MGSPGLPSAYKGAFMRLLMEFFEYRQFDAFVPFAMVPRFGRKRKIYASCSVIHVESALALLLARSEFKHYGVDLDLRFFRTSSQAVKDFLKKSESGVPALVTVTEGTANKLNDMNKRKNNYYRLLDAPPGTLRWTSPNSTGRIVSLADLFDRPLIFTDHPTDIMVVEKFRNSFADVSDAKNIAFEISPPIASVPENRDFYRMGSFFLTNSFMDRWTLLGDCPERTSWQEEEARFLYINRALYVLRDDTRQGVEAANFFRFYLGYYFSRKGRSQLRRKCLDSQAEIGLIDYLAAGGDYLLGRGDL